MGDRARSRSQSPLTELLTAGQSSPTAGRLASQTWLRNRALSGPALMPWHAEITLGVDDTAPPPAFDERTDTRFRLEIYSEEWGFFLCHRGRASWIRVTDIPFVHGRDDFGLLAKTPALKDVGGLLRVVEQQRTITFARRYPLIRTNIPSAEPVIRDWVRAL